MHPAINGKATTLRIYDKTRTRYGSRRSQHFYLHPFHSSAPEFAGQLIKHQENDYNLK